MEIKVRIPTRGKTATLEVENDHDVGWVVEVLCEELGLGGGKGWGLASSGKAVDNSKTMRDMSVFNGDRFELVHAQTEMPRGTQPDALAGPEKEETTFAAENKCSCGKRLTWISDYGRFYCYRCKKYPPQCPTCKKDLFWVRHYSKYYCNVCRSYAPPTSLTPHGLSGE